jgi:phosphotransferase system, enzyme I, PtsP
MNAIPTHPGSASAVSTSQEYSSGPAAVPTELSHGLGDLACAIGNQMQCDVCSIYRLDRQRQALILSATVGLRQDCIERLRMNITEGLCGLVVQQRQPVRIAARAGDHPNFKFFPEAGEEPYESFLGAPVINGASIVGVLVVQTIEPRSFTDREIKALVLAGRQMGPLLDQLRQQPESP